MSSADRGPLTLPHRLDIRERCWSLRSRSGRILTCAIFVRDDVWLEVRTFFGEYEFLQSRTAASVTAARTLARTWLRSALKDRPSVQLIECLV
jgi:hypothetical protein